MKSCIMTSKSCSATRLVSRRRNALSEQHGSWLKGLEPSKESGAELGGLTRLAEVGPMAGVVGGPEQRLLLLLDHCPRRNFDARAAAQKKDGCQNWKRKMMCGA